MVLATFSMLYPNNLVLGAVFGLERAIALGSVQLQQESCKPGQMPLPFDDRSSLLPRPCCLLLGFSSRLRPSCHNEVTRALA